jgi:hypothetical protein
VKGRLVANPGGLLFFEKYNIKGLALAVVREGFLYLVLWR